MKNYLCLVALILAGGNYAYAQWRCDDWGTWMMDWGITFWLQPITLVTLSLVTIGVITYILIKIRRSA